MLGIGLGLGHEPTGLGLRLGLGPSGLGLALGLGPTGFGLGLGLGQSGLDYITDTFEPSHMEHLLLFFGRSCNQTACDMSKQWV